MIINILITFFFTVQTAFMDLFPSIPAIDSEISDGGDFVLDVINDVAGVLTLIYSHGLLQAIFAITIIIVAFEPIYHTTMWVLKKIPMLNIK